MTIIEQLKEEFFRAKEAVNENAGGDQNSYGSGYDQGYMDGIKIAMTFMMGEAK